MNETPRFNDPQGREIARKILSRLTDEDITNLLSLSGAVPHEDEKVRVEQLLIVLRIK